MLAMKNFASILRHERLLHGWTQADVAEKLGSDSRTVRRWERGETIPSLYLRRKLCILFEKTPGELGLLFESTQYPLIVEETRELPRNYSPAVLTSEDKVVHPSLESLPHDNAFKKVQIRKIPMRRQARKNAIRLF